MHSRPAPAASLVPTVVSLFLSTVKQRRRKRAACGLSVAHRALPVRYPLPPVPNRRRKQLRIVGFATSIQCHVDATLKQGIQVSNPTSPACKSLLLSRTGASDRTGKLTSTQTSSARAKPPIRKRDRVRYGREPGVTMSSQERSGVVRVLGILGVATASPGDVGRGRKKKRSGRAPHWPCGTQIRLPQALASEAVQQKSGWMLLPGGETATAFQGDAVISNGHLLAIVRSRERGRALLGGPGRAGLSRRSGFNPWRRHRAGLAYGE